MVLFVKLNCTTCVSVLVRLLVSKSVLTKISLKRHPVKKGWPIGWPFFRGAVRKAKLYYLRERTSKAARIKERLN
ncbi:50S ribosomal protein L19 [Escherichia coli]